jgi:Spy/CpxP family protein refolding chaperone
MLQTIGSKGRRIAAVAAIGMALSGVAAMAQDSAPPPPPMQDQQGPPPDGMHGGPGMRGRGPERQTEMLTKQLNLTPDQVTQVKAIDADAMQQAKALRDDTSLSQDDRRSKMMTIHEGAQAKIRALLTDDQKTKFDAMVAKRHERMERHEGNGPPPPPA